MQDSVGAVVGALERGGETALAQQDEGGMEVSWQLLRQQVTQMMLARKRKSSSIESFHKFYRNVVNRNFFSMQKLILQYNGSSKNCLSKRKTSVFPRLCAKSKDYPTKRILEAAVESLFRALCLRIISGHLAMHDV